MKKDILVFVLCIACALMMVFVSSVAETETVLPAGPQIVDLDLSRLSGTVVYSQVYNIMYEPEPYIGKVIKMAGYYSAYEDTERDVVYHACIIPDATACCAQGIEFIWAGEHQWPTDYPEEGTDIIVTGKLETYEEDGFEYLHLVDAVMLLASEAGK